MAFRRHSLVNRRVRGFLTSFSHTISQNRHSEFIHPFAVETQLGLVGIEQLEHLPLVRLALASISSRESGGRYILARRVADRAGKIADQEDHRVSEVLKRLSLRITTLCRGGLQAHVGRDRALHSRLPVLATVQA